MSVKIHFPKKATKDLGTEVGCVSVLARDRVIASLGIGSQILQGSGTTLLRSGGGEGVGFLLLWKSARNAEMGQKMGEKKKTSYHPNPDPISLPPFPVPVPRFASLDSPMMGPRGDGEG